MKQTSMNLMSSMDEIDEWYERRKQEFQDQLFNEYHEYAKELRSNCKHPTTKVKEDFNYHTRETWYETICTVCKTVLERK